MRTTTAENTVAGGMGGTHPGVHRLSHPGSPHPLTTEAAPVLADERRAARRAAMTTVFTAPFTPFADCRCKGCQSLLAKRDPDGLTIRRRDLQVTINGDATVVITCHRPGCRALNVLTPRPPPRPTLESVLPKPSTA